MDDDKPQVPSLLPVMPLRETVVFPLVVTPLLVGQPGSVKLVEEVTQTQSPLVGLFLQREGDGPSAMPVYEVGTAATIQHLRPASQEARYAVVQGFERVRIQEIVRQEPYLVARVEPLPDHDDAGPEAEALVRSCRHLFHELVELSPEFPDAAAAVAEGLPSARHLAYFVASTVPLEAEARQAVLEADPVSAKLRKLIELLQHELEVHRLEQRISDATRETISGEQKRHILHERMRAIQKELGEESGAGELEELRERIAKAPLPAEARTEAEREIARLQRIPDISPEYGMIRTWLDWVLGLPWSRGPGEPIDINHSREVLDADHYDLEKVKERLLEHLAVKKLRAERQVAPAPGAPAGPAREPILCFVGPPGVGKTSLGQSIARAMGRRFVRISLGGIHDESEIRGHRRTYIGAMPGRILQAIRRGEAADPVFMLDEVDKLGAGFQGDPGAALLEVLDPAQNQAFVDTYLNVPFDLSQVLFICTANTRETIPPALLDRMELINLSGYTEHEKLHIARRYLLPRQRAASGLREEELSLDDGALARVIREYTHEAGVRSLERELSAISRKVARSIGEGAPAPVHVDAQAVPGLLGKPRVFDEVAERLDRPGVATGLAWTPTGGELLFVEAALIGSRREEVILTGMLGNVMRESARAAWTYLRSNAERFGLDEERFWHRAVHVHVPAGAIPKDGPSAGVTILAALTSAATGIPVRQKVAMTGELTLRGKVLPVGGIKEKVLAAYRSGIEHVLLPRRNERDLDEVPEEVRGKLRFHLVDSADEVLAQVLERWPAATYPQAPSHPWELM